MPYCSECGSEVGETSEFCMNCGASLSNAPTPESEQSTPQTGTGQQSVDQTGDQPDSQSGAQESKGNQALEESQEPQEDEGYQEPQQNRGQQSGHGGQHRQGQQGGHRTQPTRGGTQPNHRSDSGGALQGRFFVNSVLGGVIGFAAGSGLAVVLAPVYFIGVMLGSATGGFLHDKGSGSGAMVGGIAGILATIPFIIFLAAFILSGFSWFALQDVSTQLESEEFFAGAGAIVTVISVFALILNTICGVIGGLIGGSVAS